MTSHTDASGIDPADLATCLRVLSLVGELDADHPDSVTVQRAVGHMFKKLKRARRNEARRAKVAADRQVLATTATGSPTRIDDETAGITLSSNAPGASAGTLIRPRACYVCKDKYTRVDAFYHQLCPRCAAENHAKRDARTDLTGRRALLTGGRAKIGMYIALRLLRDGAHLTITTRFPNDAIRRFAAMEDSADWLHRLRIVGIDLRDPAQVVALADDVAAQGPLDILVNNAAQTVRRSPRRVLRPRRGRVRSPARRPAAGGAHLRQTLGRAPGRAGRVAAVATDRRVAHLARAGGRVGHARPDRRRCRGRRRGGCCPIWCTPTAGCRPSARSSRWNCSRCSCATPWRRSSWSTGCGRRWRPPPARRTYVVNVSAMEGQFAGRRYKGAGHPHTNMAKAALNMLTRTSAEDLRADGILMTAVDTGWITDERPHHTKLRLAEEGFHAPLDLVDGAARVYDPIVQGEAGVDLYGCFLKDYRPAPW